MRIGMTTPTQFNTTQQSGFGIKLKLPTPRQAGLFGLAAGATALAACTPYAQDPNSAAPGNILRDALTAPAGDVQFRKDEIERRAMLHSVLCTKPGEQVHDNYWRHGSARTAADCPAGTVAQPFPKGSVEDTVRGRAFQQNAAQQEYFDEAMRQGTVTPEIPSDFNDRVNANTDRQFQEYYNDSGANYGERRTVPDQYNKIMNPLAY